MSEVLLEVHNHLTYLSWNEDYAFVPLFALRFGRQAHRGQGLLLVVWLGCRGCLGLLIHARILLMN